MSNLNNHTVSILIVDNDENTRSSIAQIVSSQGYNCMVADNADAARVWARKNIPSLIISNTTIGNISGFEFCRAIKADSPDSEIPVLFVSNGEGTDLVAKSRAGGGVFFLSKRIDPDVLLELVDKALWMPHLIRRHVDSGAHKTQIKTPYSLNTNLNRSDSYSAF